MGLRTDKNTSSSFILMILKYVLNKSRVLILPRSLPVLDDMIDGM